MLLFNFSSQNENDINVIVYESSFFWKLSTSLKEIRLPTPKIQYTKNFRSLECWSSEFVVIGSVGVLGLKKTWFKLNINGPLKI